MAIFATYYWICELCGHTDVFAQQVDQYDDPIIDHPKSEKWEYCTDKNGIEHFVCPECWQRERDGLD